MIHFVYSWPETLDCTLSQTKFLTLPPNPVFQNSLHRNFMLIKYVVSWGSSSNRRRARSIWLGGWITSPRVWFGVGGQGVTLELAWGPSYSSLRNLNFAFAVFSIFSISSFFSLTFYLILSFALKLFFMFFLIRSWYFSLAFFSLSFSSICFFFYYPLLVRF